MTSAAYDFDLEARRVCEAVGVDNGWMTVNCALHEAYDAGLAAAGSRWYAAYSDLARAIRFAVSPDGHRIVDGFPSTLEQDITYLTERAGTVPQPGESI